MLIYHALLLIHIILLMYKFFLEVLYNNHVKIFEVNNDDLNNIIEKIDDLSSNINKNLNIKI